jgi:glycosyltransferase involved in cell wall biosynthesis
MLSGDPNASPVDRPLVSVIMPCLDEAESVAECVRRARFALERHEIAGEIIVVDNGSTDGSGLIAARAGARVIGEVRRGYGNAYRAGLVAARGTYIIMADADLTYDFEEIPRFLAEMQGGADLVMGNRMGQIHPGAMPWLNRYVGNPVMTALVNVLFRTGVRDAWCGMRALRRDVLPLLDLHAEGMEFALEMVIRASDEKLTIRELEIELHPRKGASKLLPFRDGARALRFLLVWSPRHLFVFPGALLCSAGTFMMVTVLAGINLFGRKWFLHTMIGGSLLLILGAQVLALGVCGLAYSAPFLHKKEVVFHRLQKRIRLAHGLFFGSALATVGLGLGAVILMRWRDHGFRALSEERLALLASTLVILGVLVLFVAFFLSMLSLRRPAASSAQVDSSV